MMKRKCLFLLAGLFLFFSASLAHAALLPLAPENAQYPYPVKYAVIGGNKVAFIDEGKGQPIIFIHGVSATLTSFNALYSPLIKKGYRVIGIDLLGYGKSDKPDVEYDIPFHSRTVAAFIRQQKLKYVILLGHSMGGAVSIYTALEQPALVKEMILLTPGGVIEYPWTVRWFFKTFYKQAYGNRFADVDTARKYYRESVYAWNPAMEEFLQTRERMMMHPDWFKVQKAIKGGAISSLEITREILPRLGEIRKPVLVLLAADDRLVSARKAKKNIEERNAEWKIETFNHCGHLIQYDQREKTIESILVFLK
jgi:pimeloyl-ACP methyl ester carboxylesterase